MIESTIIWFLLIWAISCVGFFALSSTMAKHQKQIFNRELEQQQTRGLSLAGWFLLVVALLLCLKQAHWSYAISYWIATLSFSALFVGLCISYYPQHVKKIALATFIMADICLLSALF